MSFCTLDCGAFRTMREACKDDPCLAKLCGQSDCMDWCCPPDNGMIAGVAIGVLVALALCIACCVWCCCCRNKQTIVVQQPTQAVMYAQPGQIQQPMMVQQQSPMMVQQQSPTMVQQPGQQPMMMQAAQQSPHQATDADAAVNAGPYSKM